MRRVSILGYGEALMRREGLRKQESGILGRSGFPFPDQVEDKFQGNDVFRQDSGWILLAGGEQK
jgi:hypothetical protein